MSEAKDYVGCNEMKLMFTDGYKVSEVILTSFHTA